MTFAEFKRRMVTGTKVRQTRNARGEVDNLFTVSVVQTNGVYLAPEVKREDGRDFWMPFPKATALKADDDGFIITYGMGIYSTYRWVK